MIELQQLTTIQEPRELEKMAAVNHCLFGTFDKWWMMACDRDGEEWDSVLWLRRN